MYVGQVTGMDNPCKLFNIVVTVRPQEEVTTVNRDKPVVIWGSQDYHLVTLATNSPGLQRIHTFPRCILCSQ